MKTVTALDSALDSATSRLDAATDVIADSLEDAASTGGDLVSSLTDVAAGALATEPARRFLRRPKVLLALAVIGLLGAWLYKRQKDDSNT